MASLAPYALHTQQRGSSLEKSNLSQPCISPCKIQGGDIYAQSYADLAARTTKNREIAKRSWLR